MALPADVRTITLKDGRWLAFREFGDPAGAPCIYTTGSPASGYAGKLMDERARELGVRWISVDKPGYGFSSFHPARTLLDWPRDIAQLADDLGLERFAVAGESGGAPFTFALAHSLGERVTTTLILAGLGPVDDPAVLQGMRRQNRLILSLARRAPWLLKALMGVMARSMSDPERARRSMKRQLASAPAVDHQVLLDPVMIQALVEAVGPGPRGVAQEMQLFARPWGFRLEDITGHVDLFHGEQDVHVPVAVARSVVAKLPDCTARIRPDQGHTVAHHLQTEVLQCVLEAR